MGQALTSSGGAEFVAYCVAEALLFRIHVQHVMSIRTTSQSQRMGVPSILLCARVQSNAPPFPVGQHTERAGHLQRGSTGACLLGHAADPRGRTEQREGGPLFRDVLVVALRGAPGAARLGRR
ncbi:hypothetical protein RHRU231_940001 [Rhodococcus ruber]|uniref:Uncharacterized protein n=1 Tax=Rhodococcus ruber TaxID=1830 RepID=A0A098BUF2_9NOCA|nr:hypothetical protein RHRU231_940001 [Rhodococcus ruber]